MGVVKKIIAGTVVTSLVVGGVAGAMAFMRRQNEVKVQVCKVGYLAASSYYNDSEMTLEGNVVANATQTISVDKDMIVDQIFVTKGQSVKVGDQLVSFDTTLIEMKLNIEKLKRLRLQLDLNRAIDRMNYIKAGGDYTEDDINGYGEYVDSPADKINQADETDDMDEASLSAGPGHRLFAVAGRFVPVFAAAVEDFFGSETAEDLFSSEGEVTDQVVENPDDPAEDPDSDAEYDEEIGDDDFDWDDLDDDDFDLDDEDFFDSSDGMMNYMDEDDETLGFSSAVAFTWDDEQTDAFSGGVGTGYYPWLSPSPTPELFASEVEDAGKAIGAYAEFEDDEIPFYKKLDWDTVPYQGSGSKGDPIIYLCSCAKGKVKVTGGLLNLMAGFDPEGNSVWHEGGYWYQLEFHKYDTIDDVTDRKQSCTGYYLINGGLLNAPVDRFAITEFLLDEAMNYEGEDDEAIDDEGLLDEDAGDLLDEDGELDDGELEDEEEVAPVTREEVLNSLKKQIRTMQLDLQESDITISGLEKQVNRKVIYSKLDGSVASLSGKTGSSSFMTIKSSEGYFVRGKVSELHLDDIVEGTQLACSSWSGPSFDAEVIDVSEYPTDSENGFYSYDQNPNASNYYFTATILDKEKKVSDSDYLDIKIKEDANASKGIVLEKAFVRSENGRKFVLKDVDGVLQRQYIKVKAIVDGGQSVLIGAGIHKSDLIAFPYGDGVVEGAKTIEVDVSKIKGY